MIPPGEKIVETKTCPITGEQFVVTDGDKTLYDKFEMGSPIYCPEESIRNMHAFRNEWGLYTRKCNKSGKTILSQYSPDKPYPVYENNVWWSDDWSPFDYGRTYDFDRPFFDQYLELQHVVPREGATVFKSENCDYNSHVRESRDCYMCSLGHKNDQVYYSYWGLENISVFDCLMFNYCEQCYECIDIEECYGCTKSQELRNCRDCHFSYALTGCDHCIACSNLSHKKYHIFNKEYPEEDFEKMKRKIFNGEDANWQVGCDHFDRIYRNALHNQYRNLKCENVVGDYVLEGKDCFQVFDVRGCEKCRYSVSIGDSFNVTHSYSVGWNACKDVYMCSVVRGSNDVAMSFHVYYSDNIRYTDTCYSSQNLCGCVGIKSSSNCILNTNYSQQEYDQLLLKIRDHMRSTGEWGSFFPYSHSPFAYNESSAGDFMPLDTQGVQKRGGYWYENEEATYVGDTYHRLPTSQYDERIVGPETAKTNIERCAGGAHVCAKTGRPFRIIQKELAFYIENGIPLPQIHPFQRHRDRLTHRNPRKLFSSKCKKCHRDIHATYDPEKNLKVVCEECYRKEVY